MGRPATRDGRAGRPAVAEARDVGLVERGEVRHVDQEAQGLLHVVERRAHRGQLPGDVLDRLRGLAGHTVRQLAVLGADLAGDDQPVAGPHDRRVGTEGLLHGGAPSWRRGAGDRRDGGPRGRCSVVPPPTRPDLPRWSDGSCPLAAAADGRPGRRAGRPASRPRWRPAARCPVPRRPLRSRAAPCRPRCRRPPRPSPGSPTDPRAAAHVLGLGRRHPGRRAGPR